MAEIDISDPKMVAQHIRAMRNSTGYQILLQFWNCKREQIIEEGKKGRKDEKLVKMWATLQGFDDCVSMVAKLAESDHSDSESPELED